MFLYNLHWRWNLFSITQPHGFCFHPISINQVSAINRNIHADNDRIRLFDPSICFWNLDYRDASRACNNIASYNYVPIDFPPYNKEEHGNVKDWLDNKVGLQAKQNWPPKTETDQDIEVCLTKCFEFQEEFEVSHIIIPTPHICSPSDDLSTFVKWLDIGLSMVQNSSKQTLLSVSVSDLCEIEQFEMILAHLKSRDNLKGIYLSLENSRSDKIGPEGINIAKFLLDVSYLLGHRENLDVFINHADIFGYACLAIGATAFASGYESKTKRLKHALYDDNKGGGRAFPRFFSYKTGRSYRVKNDLNKIRDSRLLHIFEEDITSESEPLLMALNSGKEADDVPTWRESPNNITSARRHLVERLVSASDFLNSIDDFTEKNAFALEWLQNAEMINTHLENVFHDDPLKDEGGNIKEWRVIFQEHLNKYNIL